MPRWGLGRVVFLSYTPPLPRVHPRRRRVVCSAAVGAAHAGWVPSLAFVQAPVPVTAAGPTSNPFLPTPAPSPESPVALWLNSTSRLTNKYSASSESSTCTSLSSAASAGARRHGYSSSLAAAAAPTPTNNSVSITSAAVNFDSGSSLQPPPPPPMHPLRLDPCTGAARGEFFCIGICIAWFPFGCSTVRCVYYGC
ncbi:hypothetical protein B0H13DRAFT_741563 [Mycena leptocephala]|nr:hypothetical protein B0H13DRAFT_741563 [Mycena leptocephala]